MGLSLSLSLSFSPLPPPSLPLNLSCSLSPFSLSLSLSPSLPLPLTPSPKNLSSPSRVLLSKELVAGGHLEKNLSNTLAALVHYFRTPDKLSLSHDQYQRELCQLRERQNLFNKQVGSLMAQKEILDLCLLP